MMAPDGNEDMMHRALRRKKIGFMPPSRQLGTVFRCCIQLTELHPNSLHTLVSFYNLYFYIFIHSHSLQTLLMDFTILVSCFFLSSWGLRDLPLNSSARWGRKKSSKGFPGGSRRTCFLVGSRIQDPGGLAF